MKVHIEGKTASWFRRKLVEWGRNNYTEFPWRSAKSPIHQLIVELLLQRTRARQVVPVFTKLQKEFPTINDLHTMSEEDVTRLINPLGLHWRAPLLYRLIQTVATKHKGVVPDDYNTLLTLSGIGPYAASAFLSLHRNRRMAIVDSNVVRIYGRFFGFEYDGETRRKKWLLDLAESLIPTKAFRDYNYAVLDIARIICKRTPMCNECPLRTKCSHNLSGHR